MKRTFAFVLVAGTSIVSASFAQITVTQTQVEGVFTPGNTVRFYQDTTDTSVNVGPKGGPHVYDFSGLPFVYVGRESVFFASQISELAPRYPAGTVSLRIEDGFGGFEYVNFTFPSGRWQNEGEAHIFSTPMERYRRYSPYELETLFPITYNDRVSHSFTSVETTYFNGVPIQIDGPTALAESVIVDGYGTLMLPGLTLNCLRVRKVEYQGGDFQGFTYYTQEGAAVLVSSRAAQPDTGLIQIEDIFYFLGGSLSSVVGTDDLPGKFSLLQNYPNPFNPSTTIRYALPRTSFATLRVFNLLGQEVASLFAGEQSAGEHSVEWAPQELSSGVYLYRLQADAFVETKKLVLIK